MIYMVEMALLDTARRAEWEAWYTSHQRRLLSIPGFRASQRFETIHPAPAPFIALHQVDSADIFTGPTYKTKAGPTNTGEWQAKMNNWHRNLFALDRSHSGPATLGDRVPVQWMDAVGLDRSVRRRGLAVMPPATADRLVGTPNVRVLKPLAARLVS